MFEKKPTPLSAEGQSVNSDPLFDPYSVDSWRVGVGPWVVDANDYEKLLRFYEAAINGR